MSALTSPAGPSAAPLTFTTLLAPPSSRLSLWREHCRHHAPAFRCAPLGSDDLRISTRRTQLGPFEVVEVTGDGNLMERTPELVASAPSNRISVGILTRGTAFVSGNGIQTLAAGDVLLYDADVPCAYGRSAGFAEIVINVRRDVFVEISAIEDRWAEPRIVRRSGSRDAGLAARMSRLQAALSRPDVDEAEGSAAVEDLLEHILADSRGPGHWDAAQAVIRRRLDDPGLGVAAVAAAVGIGERQLAREFAARGTTVGGEIAERRMRRARELVTDVTLQRLPISRIAAMVGFLSSAHFARAFRQAHGASASELRGRLRDRLST